MSSYLGLYIEKNIIKYAKVSKEKDTTKIDSFGLKFYTDLNKTIKQIVEETYSYKIPISINLKNETYQYFDMFSLLTKRDLDKAIDIEFDNYCIEKGWNRATLENRFALVNNIDDKEKVKVINVTSNRGEINKLKDELDNYRLGYISPIAMDIPNIVDMKEGENALIVNIEDDTKVTTIVDRKVYEIATIEQGANEVLEKINMKENSYAKAYEICKNTTIYTADVQNFSEEHSRYLDEIMPTLYSIVGQIQKIINTSSAKIKKIYLTGTLSCINNIDLYFQEYLENVKCEIIRPYFVKTVSKDINIKDYIEVNSAISLALQGLGEGIDSMNFKEGFKVKEGFSIPKKILIPVAKNKVVTFSVDDFKADVTKYENIVTRIALTLMLVFILFTGFSKMITTQIANVQSEADKAKKKIQEQIKLIDSDITKINSKTTEYVALTEEIETANDKKSDINQSKNLIPNLLTHIMSVIPEGVQITSIENTTGKRIVIETQSSSYQDIAIFKGMLKTQNILKDAISGSGVKQGDIIKVTIEGDLP